MSRPLFILSPANSTGPRAQMLMNPRAQFPLARRLHSGGSAPLSEIFTFLSGLYFRGKVNYAKHFATSPGHIYVITSNRGLLLSETATSLKDLIRFGETAIDVGVAEYEKPLRESAVKLALQHEGNWVLLGSISTGKYVEPLLDIAGERLLFPKIFVGRGDMSRGGLLLRCIAEAKELEYIPVSGAVRRGKRPPRLAPQSWGYKING
ncbi:MAG: hypothetical protein SFY81_11440 [Verrucomicrobiota bacterium]|nr:hypothetical protein [Verrucomicrobiota bacterium]